MPELITVQPGELVFRFELRKQMSCSLRLRNVSNEVVAFKVKTTAPKKYCVRPNAGVIQPQDTCDVAFTMQAQKEAPADFQCKDKFLIQTVVVAKGTTVTDLQPEMFKREDDNQDVCETKLKIVYLPGDAGAAVATPAASKQQPAASAGKPAQQEQRKLDPRSPGSTSSRSSTSLCSSRVKLSILFLILGAIIGVLAAYAMNNYNNYY